MSSQEQDIQHLPFVTSSISAYCYKTGLGRCGTYAVNGSAGNGSGSASASRFTSMGASGAAARVGSAAASSAWKCSTGTNSGLASGGLYSVFTGTPSLMSSSLRHGFLPQAITALTSFFPRTTRSNEGGSIPSALQHGQREKTEVAMCPVLTSKSPVSEAVPCPEEPADREESEREWYPPESLSG